MEQEEYEENGRRYFRPKGTGARLEAEKLAAYAAEAAAKAARLEQKRTEAKAAAESEASGTRGEEGLAEAWQPDSAGDDAAARRESSSQATFRRRGGRARQVDE